jgi:uncharacterized alkaline shock family protein YloU
MEAGIMAEKETTTTITEQSELGQINISGEVLEIITNISTKEIEGVMGLSGNITDEIAGIFSRKSHMKGVVVTVDEKVVTIDVNIIVNFGVKIPEVAWKVQENIKTSIESMTGMKVDNVNVNIAGINY